MRLSRGVLALAVVPLALTACGSSSSSAGTGSTTSAAPASSSATPSASAATVQTASATVAGAPTVVLTTSAGLTLYYRTTDTATSVTCTGACAANWPPLLAGSGAPTGSAQVTGTLTVFAGPLGSQVLYNGHPLYTWAKDTAPGMATGQGIGGFKVATPSLT